MQYLSTLPLFLLLLSSVGAVRLSAPLWRTDRDLWLSTQLAGAPGGDGDVTVSSPAANEMAAAEALAELGIFRDPWVYVPNGPVCWTGGSGGACASTDPAPQPPGEDRGDEADEEDPWDDDLQRELENELAELGEDEGPAGAAGAEPGAGLPSKKPTTAAEAGPPAAGGDGEAKAKEEAGGKARPIDGVDEPKDKRKKRKPHSDASEHDDLVEGQRSVRAVDLVTFSHPKTAEGEDGATLKEPGKFSRRQILAAVAETNKQRQVHLAIDKMVVFRETHSTGKAPRDPHEGMGPRAAARLMVKISCPISSVVQRTCNPRATHVQHHVQRDGLHTRNHNKSSSV